MKKLKNKRFFGSALAIAFILTSFVLVASSQIALAQDNEEGQFVDEIRVEVRTSQTTGLGDTGSGALDAFLYNVPGNKFEGLSEEMRQNIGRMKSLGSYTNLYFNPVHTENYTVNLDNEYIFNPYSIQKVRYAMNWLVSRETIVQQVYGGYAEPRYLGISSSHAAWDEKFAPIIENAGITSTADLEKARNMVVAAMETAMNDSALKGELKKMDSDDSPVGYWWAYKGPNEDQFSPIEIDIVERLDERKQIGSYFASRIKKVGFKPNEHAWGRTKALSASLLGDPKTNIKDWNVYTGGWGASGAYYYNEWSAYQMYASFYGYMPGGLVGPTAWKYKTPEINDVTKPLLSGALQNKSEYWRRFRKGLRLGLEDSVRVFLTTSYSYYPYNKNNVTSHIQDIKTGWSDVFTPRTIKSTDDALVTAQFSDTGSLFMSNWNRIGGSTDVYSVKILRMMRDYAVIGNPTTGKYMPMRGEWSNVRRNVDFEGGNMNPKISVPDDALVYNTGTEEWKQVSDNTKAASAVTYDYQFSKWQDGHMMDDQDLLAWWAFAKEWSYQDGENDKKYNSTWSGQLKSTYNKIEGVVWHGDGEVTIYGDYTFPVESKIAGFYAGGVLEPFKPWQINYAVGELVSSDEPSPVQGQSYTWEKSEGSAWVHFLSKSQGKDYKAVLKEISNQGQIPPYLKEQNNSPFPISEEQLTQEIQSINSFYDTYGHYYDSNGPFVLTLSDPQNLVMELKRVTQVLEDPNYPYDKDYWSKRLKRIKLTLGSLNVPTTVNKGDSIDVKISANITQTYPKETSSPADRGKVTLELRKNKETVYSTEASLEEAGEFTATIPSSLTENLDTGSYTVMVKGSLADQPLGADTSSKSIILQESGGGGGGGGGGEEGTGSNTVLIAGAVIVIILVVVGVYYYR